MCFEPLLHQNKYSLVFALCPFKSSLFILLLCPQWALKCLCLAPSADLINVLFCSSSRWLIKMLNKIKLNNTITHSTLQPLHSKWTQMQLAFVSIHSLLWYYQSIQNVFFLNCIRVCKSELKSPLEEITRPWIALPARYQQNPMLCASQFDADFYNDIAYLFLALLRFSKCSRCYFIIWPFQQPVAL